jgi:hypothetical protein
MGTVTFVTAFLSHGAQTWQKNNGCIHTSRCRA